MNIAQNSTVMAVASVPCEDQALPEEEAKMGPCFLGGSQASAENSFYVNSTSVKPRCHPSTMSSTAGPRPIVPLIRTHLDEHSQLQYPQPSHHQQLLPVTGPSLQCYQQLPQSGTVPAQLQNQLCANLSLNAAQQGRQLPHLVGSRALKDEEGLVPGVMCSSGESFYDPLVPHMSSSVSSHGMYSNKLCTSHAR